jgi:hypothetical protein
MRSAFLTNRRNGISPAPLEVRPVRLPSTKSVITAQVRHERMILLASSWSVYPARIPVGRPRTYQAVERVNRRAGIARILGDPRRSV